MGADVQGFYATAGFPGLSIGYLRGLGDTVDVGGRFSFNYAGEGATTAPWQGLKLAGDFKLRVDQGLPFALTLRALPGFGLYFWSGFSILFLQVPLEAAVAIPLSNTLLAHVSVEVPVSFGFWSTSLGSSFPSMQLPILFGGGVELKLDQALSLTGQLHLGPYFGIIFGASSNNSFAFDALIGVTYRLL